MKQSLRLTIPLSVVFLLLGALASPPSMLAQGRGKAPELPFRVAPDGRVNFQDMMKLSQRPAASDRITDEELEAIKDEYAIEYGKGFSPTEVPEMPPRNDLYANSVILSDGVNHTLLPTQCLIHVPEIQADRVVDEPVGKLVLWPDFLKRHRAWLRSQEVTLEMAKGESSLSKERLEIFAMGNAIVVAVLQGNPISMLPPKEPLEGPDLRLTMPGSGDEKMSPGETSGASSQGSAVENAQTKAEAAESLAKIEAEAKEMAADDQAKRSATTTRQGSSFRDRTKSRFGRLSN